MQGTITDTTSDLDEFSGKFGIDKIAGFVAGTGSTHDTVQFSASDFASYSVLQNAMSKKGANVVITLDSTDTLTITNQTIGALVSADFKFV